MFFYVSIYHLNKVTSKCVNLIDIFTYKISFCHNLITSNIQSHMICSPLKTTHCGMNVKLSCLFRSNSENKHIYHKENQTFWQFAFETRRRKHKRDSKENSITIALSIKGNFVGVNSYSLKLFRKTFSRWIFPLISCEVISIEK